MSPEQAVKILDKQLANDYYFLFTKALHSVAVVLLLRADHYDGSRK